MRVFIGKFLSGYRLSEKPFVKKAMESLIRLLNPIKVLDHKMYINPKDDSLGLFRYGSYELPVIDVFKKYIKKGDTALDLGAYIGYHTLIMAKLTGSEGEVYAFEPDAVNFDYLKKNVEDNGYANNVTAVCKAISNRTGKGRLYYGNSASLHTIYDPDGKKWTEVDVVSLDDYFKDKKIDFIKMDIEGAEGMALEGMKNMLENNPNLKMVIEYQPEMLKKAGTDPKEFLETLKAFGFKSVKVDNKNWFFER